MFKLLITVPVALVAGTAWLLAASSEQPEKSPQDAPKAEAAAPLVVVDPVVRGGLMGKWQDYGWARRDIGEGDRPSRVDFSNYGGWIIAKPGAAITASAVRIEYKIPSEDHKHIELYLGGTKRQKLPAAKLRDHAKEGPDGWLEAEIPLATLNPNGLNFDRVVVRAFRSMPADWVVIRTIAFLGTAGAEGEQPKARATDLTGPISAVELEVDCTQPTRPINSMIYGIAFGPRHYKRDRFYWEFRPAARRWGGNPASRYNWELGNAWNTAADWFYRNINYTGDKDFTWRRFLADNRKRDVYTALTVPLLGWRAKDTRSYSFPVKQFGAQQKTEPGKSDRGNGLKPDGTPIAPGPQSLTSEPNGPEDVKRWMKAITDWQGEKRSVDIVLLGNEPMLWHETHRDVITTPMGYDDLMERTVAYGRAVRDTMPDALIAGPSVWGWPAYHYSAKDKEAGFRLRPDRRAHGDMALIPWYLRELSEYQRRTGVRILDLVNVHFYPMGKGVLTKKSDRKTAALRIRSTRALWDPTYKDESWIGENIMLIPRMQQWIEQYYPGLGMMIGEYNFGGEQHMSGALALAEALGRFGQHGVKAAFYWTYPPSGSPTAEAFKAYRNYDGKGGQFKRNSVKSTSAEDVSLFASRNESGTQLVLVALNHSPETRKRATIKLGQCGRVTAQRAFRFEENGYKLESRDAPRAQNDSLGDDLPPYSISVYELTVR